MNVALLSIDPKRSAAHIEELRGAVLARDLVGRVVRQGGRFFYRVEGVGHCGGAGDQRRGR